MRVRPPGRAQEIWCDTLGCLSVLVINDPLQVIEELERSGWTLRWLRGEGRWQEGCWQELCGLCVDWRWDYSRKNGGEF